MASRISSLPLIQQALPGPDRMNAAAPRTVRDVCFRAPAGKTTAANMHLKLPHHRPRPTVGRATDTRGPTRGIPDTASSRRDRTIVAAQFRATGPGSADNGYRDTTGSFLFARPDTHPERDILSVTKARISVDIGSSRSILYEILSICTKRMPGNDHSRSLWLVEDVAYVAAAQKFLASFTRGEARRDYTSSGPCCADSSWPSRSVPARACARRVRGVSSPRRSSRPGMLP